MKFQVMRFGAAIAILWGLIVFLIALANLIFPGYGVAFLNMVDSIYPGYVVGRWAFGGVLVGTAYAALDGFIGGIVFAWLYNKLSKS